MAQVVAEDGMAVGAQQLFLRVVQREGTEVVRLIVVHFQLGDLRFFVAEDDAETGREVGTCVEIMR